ncbi:MAG: glycosyltransferase, partial [Acidimicrobiales bacterium]
MAAPPAAPAVVVVVVASDPGTWFEEVLVSLGAQDYPNLSVLVADAGAGEDGVPTSLVQRVAAVLPDAHLARVGACEGFARAANQVLELVEGATHVLLCHDDVAFEPSTVRLMVEEAYRSNAGLVCPKLVMWDATDRLLSVGMGADRLGGVYQLAQPGELDQGQHDGVREVFVAPGGATLVRTDLWRALGGFNPGTGAPGEDLDLCWRAQVAGARVIVAPQAPVRHLEASARGLRKGPQAVEGGSNGAGRQGNADWHGERRLREEHRLRTLWTCYGTWSLVLVVPVVLVFALGESALAMLRPRPGGSHGWRGRWRESLLPLLALTGSLRYPKELWEARRRAQDLRRASDMALWRSRSRGSARLRPVLRLRVESNHGLSLLSHLADARRSYLAHGHGPSFGEKPADGGPEARQLGSRVDWRVTAGVATVLVAVLLVGSRDILSAPLPLVGQIPSAVGGVGGWWHAWWDGLGPAGLEAMPVAPPGLAFMALVGTVTAGSASFALHVL